MWSYNYTNYNYDILCHHGVKGMKWGVRRYQRKDGTLTKAGLKRQKKVDNAIHMLQAHKKYAKQDIEYFTKESEKAKNKKISDKAIEKFLMDAYGNDSKDKVYMQDVAEHYGYKNIKDYARAEINSDFKHIKTLPNEARRYVARCDQLIQKYSNIKVSEMSKEDLKEAKEIANRSYALSNIGNKYNPLYIDKDNPLYIDKD